MLGAVRDCRVTEYVNIAFPSQELLHDGGELAGPHCLAQVLKFLDAGRYDRHLNVDKVIAV